MEPDERHEERNASEDVTTAGPFSLPPPPPPPPIPEGFVQGQECIRIVNRVKACRRSEVPISTEALSLQYDPR